MTMLYATSREGVLCYIAHLREVLLACGQAGVKFGKSTERIYSVAIENLHMTCGRIHSGGDDKQICIRYLIKLDTHTRKIHSTYFVDPT
jgi:hypothetical protein